MYMQYLCSIMEINKKCCPWSAKVVSLGEMSSDGRQGAKCHWGLPWDTVL